MKVTLINPPVIGIHSPFKLSPTPPLGLALIASSLENELHEVIIIDAVAEAPNNVEFYLNKNIEKTGLSNTDIIRKIPEDSDIIGFSCMFTDNWIHTRNLIDEIGNTFPKAILIAGGEHFTALPEQCLNEAKMLKCGVIGEGEDIIINLIDHLKNNFSLSNCPGIAFKNENEIIKTKRAKRIQKVNEIPLPSWHLFPLDKYEKYKLSYGVNKDLTLPILATRGCPYECTFCSSPIMWGRQYLMRSPDLVFEEIIYFKEKYGVTHFDFYDLTAILKKTWIVEFCNLLIKNKVNITWQIPAGTRAEVIDYEVSKLLFKSGCRKITYAPESGSNKVLKEIKKKVKIPSMLSSIKSSNKAGINVKLNMIIGFPTETHLDIWKTWWFLIKCSWFGAYDALPGTLSAYPGTQLFKEIIGDRRLNDDDYFRILKSSSIFDAPNHSKYISKTMIRFYFWFIIFSFYLSNYIFRPIRVITTIKNLISKNYYSRAEQALGRFLFRE